MKLTKQPSQQQGSMLLEALIAILIFSMGILALVGLQAASIKSVADAKYRTDASFLANQLIGEMWVDKPNIASYAYAGSGAVPAKLTVWADAVSSALPGASAHLPKVTVGLTGEVKVEIFWQPPQDASPHNFTAVAYIEFN